MSGTLPPEFGFIARHFRPLAGPGALDLRDDAAVFAPPPGRELVVAADALVQGVHFRPDDPAETVGRKLLRANLSDMAAMGAVPFGYLLTMTLPPDLPDTWVSSFAQGLAADQAAFGLGLLGGDTTRGPALCLSLTMLGHVAPGQALRRNGAQPDDGLWVTGTIGDGALGLLALEGQVPDPDEVLADRYRVPRPRLGLALHGIVHAAMDVSDGLVQDAGHLARESGLSVRIEADAVPISAAARAASRTAGLRGLEICLTGGDDYELLLAVPDDAGPALQREAQRVGVTVTQIGRFTAGAPEVSVSDSEGRPVILKRQGWSHL